MNYHWVYCCICTRALTFPQLAPQPLQEYALDNLSFFALMAWNGDFYVKVPFGLRSFLGFFFSLLVVSFYILLHFSHHLTRQCSLILCATLGFARVRLTIALLFVQRSAEHPCTRSLQKPCSNYLLSSSLSLHPVHLTLHVHLRKAEATEPIRC